MTSGQRKAHKYVWLLIGIIVPVLIIFTLKDIINLTSKQPFESSYNTALKTDSNNLLVATTVEIEDAIMLRFEIKEPIKSASSEVYELTKNNEKGKYLGELTTAKAYSFKTSLNASGILIYDSIKDIEITKLMF